jgi:hypothetical protein
VLAVLSQFGIIHTTSLILVHVAPLGWEHIALTGDYSTKRHDEFEHDRAGRERRDEHRLRNGH